MLLNLNDGDYEVESSENIECIFITNINSINELIHKEKNKLIKEISNELIETDKFNKYKTDLRLALQNILSEVNSVTNSLLSINFNLLEYNIDLFKYLKIEPHIDDCLLNNIINYLDIITQLYKNPIIFIFNVEQYLNNKEISLLLVEIELKKITIIFVSSIAIDKLIKYNCSYVDSLLLRECFDVECDKFIPIRNNVDFIIINEFINKIKDRNLDIENIIEIIKKMEK